MRIAWRAWTCAAGLAVAALAAGLVFARRSFDSYDASIMFRVTESMIRDHDFIVPRSADLFHFNSPYASYGLGMSLVYAPFSLVAERLHRDPVDWAMSANAFIFAATVVTVFWLVLRLRGRLRHAVASAVLTGFCTSLLPSTSTGFSEPGVALAVALGLVGVTLVRERWWLGAALAGAAAGGALLMRTDSLALVAPILGVGVWLGGARHWRVVPAFVAGAAPFFATWAWYNDVRFGAPWHLGYGGQGGFSHAWLPGVVGLLVSPGAGLLWYVPVVAVAAAGWGLAWRRLPVVVSVAVALVLARIALYAAWWDWPGMVAWGPRFLVPAMPALAVGLFEVVRRFDSLPFAARVAVPAIAMVSLGVQVVGATVRPEGNQMIQAFNLLATNAPAARLGCASAPRRPSADDVLFDWRCFPIAGETEQLLTQKALLTGRYLNQPYDWKVLGGLALVVLLGLNVAWAAASTRPPPIR